MMETSLTTSDWKKNLVPSAEEQDKIQIEIAESQNFLASLKFLQNTSKEVGNTTICSPPPIAGEFFLTLRNRRIANPIVSIFGFRPHALLIIDGKKTKESFDASSPIFQEIKNFIPSQRDSQLKMWTRAEFLVYLPEEAEWACLFPGNEKLHQAVDDIITYMRPPELRKESKQDLPHTNVFQLESKLQQYGPVRKSWVFQVIPKEPSNEFYPDEEAITKMYEKFVAPVRSEPRVEVATAVVER